MKTLLVEWQRLLDEQNETCPRCGSTEHEIEKAVRELNQMLAPSEIVVNLVRKAIDLETFHKDAIQSNKILIAGRTLEEWLGASTGQSRCCETCGDADCRTVEYGGDTHEAIPAQLVVRAGIAAAADLFKIQPPQIRERIPVVKLKFKKA